MIKFLRAISLFIITATFSNCSNAQVIILASDLTNPPATSCTITFYTVSGTLANTNYGYSGPVVSVVGFNISITKDYFSGFAPIPGLTPFSEDIDLGMLPEGLYEVTTTSLVDGFVSSIDIGSFNVETCCTGSVDLGADSTICDTSSLLLDVTIIGGSYVWNDGSTNPVFTIDTAGIYWVDVTDSNGCVYSDTISVVTEDCSVGLEDILTEQSFIMVPNPAVSSFQILGLKEGVKVSISTLTGKNVKIEINNESIDISNLIAGIYIVRVEFDGLVRSERLMIQN